MSAVACLYRHKHLHSHSVIGKLRYQMCMAFEALEAVLAVFLCYASSRMEVTASSSTNQRVNEGV